ncbi:MAG: PEP/pyruvate-binding domain-containing protein [Thermodesulfobacteriota bacterium]
MTASETGATEARQKYQGLQSLLGGNSRLLETMADLEADLRFLPLGSASLEHQIRDLLEGTLLTIEDLNYLADSRYRDLYTAFLKIEQTIGESLEGSRRMVLPSWVRKISEIGLGHSQEVGGKAAHLGELKKILPEVIPDGFAVTAAAYQAFMSEPVLAAEIRALLDTLEVSSDLERFKSKAGRIRDIILKAHVLQPIAEAIRDAAAALFPPSQRWAVRSSAVGEDGPLTFAGQFESFLNVPSSQLVEAYLKVLASRFNDRAITYRLLGGFTEVATPMAVLFIPVIEARSAGVIYTQDPGRPAEDQLLISSTWGLAGDLVSGRTPADLFRVDRKAPSLVKESQGALKKRRLICGDSSHVDRVENSPADQQALSLSTEEIQRLSALALTVERHLDGPQDLEWAIDQKGKIWILQARPLKVITHSEDRGSSQDERPILSGGQTIFPGRAVAPVQVILDPKEFPLVSEGVILVVPQAVPEIASVLPLLAGFIAEQGQPTGHAATLLREFAVPSLFDLPGATEKLTSGTMVGLDASHRQVFLGQPWPDIRERTMARMAQPKINRPSSPLNALILKLNLTDPQSRHFKPESCESIHDLIRFVHEKGVAAFFEVGDRETRKRQTPTRRLASSLALDLYVRELENALAPEALPKKEVRPEEIRSLPFQALWRGMSHPQVSWAGRKEIDLKGFASVMVSSLGQDMGAMRKLGDPNYLLVGPDYLNLNIRLAYHYAMVDSLVGPVIENNYVNFRFQGGGGSRERRDLRARFLKEVLLSSRFSVDLRGDLITAWLRGYAQPPSEAGLELLGKLMGCARQLDMLMENETVMRRYVDRFLAGDYQAFA